MSSRELKLDPDKTEFLLWPSITSGLGQCIMFSGVSGSGMGSVTIIMQQSENPAQSPNAVSMTGQRRRLWVNIETALGECHVFAKYTVDPV